MILLYIAVLISLFVYSYALVDPNLTLINNQIWVGFRDTMVQFGYYQRQDSWHVYVALIVALFAFHFLFVKNFKKYNPLLLGGIIGAILLMAYPLLSHDLFNYIFDAKIFTFYKENPYTHMPSDYEPDEWLRFMQWTHRTYPYGPTYLIFSYIPSFLGFGKFILNFFFFKLASVLSYIAGIYFISKFDKKAAIVFATHPLVLIEGLVSAHNDLIGVSFAIAGMYYVSKDNNILGRILLLFSGGIKYLTAPLILFQKKNKLINLLIFLVAVSLVLYLSIMKDLQSWYFLTLFAFLPLYKNLVSFLQILFIGLLLSYYPYITTGFWYHDPKVYIVLTAAVLNVVYLIFKRKEFIQEFLPSK